MLAGRTRARGSRQLVARRVLNFRNPDREGRELSLAAPRGAGDGTPVPTPIVARAVKLAGIVLLLGGTAHTAGVLHRLATKGTPDGHRVAYLAFIAFVHWTCGALDVLASGGLRRAEPWATRVLVVSSLLLTAYGVTVSPLLTASGALVRLMPVLYPAVHLALLAAVARGAPRA
jgi:hypothetical protein